jgi:hypothetical protein
VSLFTNLRSIAAPESIDLRLCSVQELIKGVRGARLICADPPWLYSENPGGANPEMNNIYRGCKDADIVRHLSDSFDSALPDSRLACWYTWPKDAEWNAAGGAGKWGPRVTGGAWLKTGQVGVGYHWRGQTEPVAIFARGTVGRSNECILNGFQSVPGAHSEKPVEWLRSWVRAWTAPGDLVMDLYAGRAPLARACLAEGRRYVGAEIDPDRHAMALTALARYQESL